MNERNLLGNETLKNKSVRKLAKFIWSLYRSSPQVKCLMPFIFYWVNFHLSESFFGLISLYLLPRENDDHQLSE